MDNFDLKKYLTENQLVKNYRLIKEDQDLDAEIAALEKRLSILKNKKTTGGTKLTPAQLQKVEASLKKMYSDNEFDESDVMGYAADLTLTTLLDDKWEGKEITNDELMNYGDEMAQSLGYKDKDDLEKYTDTIANKVMGF